MYFHKYEENTKRCRGSLKEVRSVDVASPILDSRNLGVGPSSERMLPLSFPRGSWEKCQWLFRGLSRRSCVSLVGARGRGDRACVCVPGEARVASTSGAGGSKQEERPNEKKRVIEPREVCARVRVCAVDSDENGKVHRWGHFQVRYIYIYIYIYACARACVKFMLKADAATQILGKSLSIPYTYSGGSIFRISTVRSPLTLFSPGPATVHGCRIVMAASFGHFTVCR
jgi:hypothetical protein